MGSNKKIIYEFESEIDHRINDLDMSKALEALNNHLVGTNKLNKCVENKIVENVKVTKHPNYLKLKEAHYKMFATVTKIPIKVCVYDDGSHDIKPIGKELK
jgi:hypothetical protein